MLTIADLIFGNGKQAPEQIALLRSRVLNATTLFAVEDRVLMFVEEQAALGSKFEPSGGIYDSRTQAKISRDQLLEMHSYQLRYVTVNGGGYGIQIAGGPVMLLGWTGPVQAGTVVADIAAIVVGTSRPRPIWRRLWLLAPWALLAVAVVALGLGIQIGREPLDILALSIIVALSAVASTGASMLIYRSIKSYYPPSIIRPYRWREIVASRLTATIGIAAALGGAALGALITVIWPR